MGFSNSLGINFANNMWSQQMMPNFNNGFSGWNNACNFNTPIWGSNFSWGTPSWNVSATPASQSTSINPSESADEYEARIKKEIAKKNSEKRDLISQKQEYQQALEQIEEQENALDGKVKKDGSVEIKGAVQEDGTIKSNKEEKLSEMSTGSKILRGGMNALGGIGNVLKSFVGFDSKTGKWDPIKCLRNAAIAFGVGTLCVFAAPIGAAAAAGLASAGAAAGAATAVGTAITAIPAALAYTGLATGVYMTGKGIYDTNKALNANNLEEFDNATQDIGAGAFIGAASAAGLKGISKAAGVDAATTAAQTAGSAANAAKTSFLSKIAASAKDVFVTPWKAASTNFNWAQTGYASGGLSGARQAVLRGQADVARNAFNANAQKLQTQLETKLTDLEARMATANPQEKALLELEYDGVFAQYSKIADMPATKAQWSSFGRADKAYNAELKSYKKAMRPWSKGEVEVKGYKFTSDNKSALTKAIKSIRTSQKSVDSQLATIKTEKMSLMRSMAKCTGRRKALAQEFGFSTEHWYDAPFNWLQSKYYGFTMPKGAMGKTMMLANGGMLVAEPWWALQSVAKTSNAMSLNNMFAFDPLRTKMESEGTTVIPAEQYAQVKTECETRKKQIQDAIGQIDAQLGVA